MADEIRLVNLNKAILETYEDYKSAAKAMGYADQSPLTRLLRQEPEKLRSDTIKRIKSAFKNHDINWLIDGDKVNDPIISNQSNAKIIGELEHYDYLSDSKFIEISPGRYKMRIPLVPEYARAGYLAGFSDKEYMETLPIHEPIVNKYHRGRYIAFEVSGDSMDDDSKRSIPHGAIVTCREIKRELWRSKFHTHKYPYYVIVHNTDGILIKEIIKHDTEKGIILLHSLNPDKEEYPDFEVSLDDVQQIFNVVKKEETY